MKRWECGLTVSLTHFLRSRLHGIKVLAPIAVQAQDLRSFA